MLPYPIRGISDSKQFEGGFKKPPPHLRSQKILNQFLLYHVVKLIFGKSPQRTIV